MGARLMPRSEQSEQHREDINWGPLSEVIAAGTPKRLIHAEKSARVQSEDVMAERGIASGQRVVLSMIVNR